MNNQRTIHVKGIGTASTVPDYVVITMELSASHREYVQAMRIGAQKIQKLREAICDAGFSAEDLKTTNFFIDAQYKKRRENENMEYQRVLTSYACKHSLKLSFDMDNSRLERAITAIGECLSKPEMTIAFTVKDTKAIKDCILKSAAEDAKRKAEILCKASGVTLGDLIRMEYSWNEISIANSFEIGMPCVSGLGGAAAGYDFQPDDIEAGDTVDFFWEIR